MSPGRDEERVDAALREALSGMPRPRASGDFTARVLARVRTAPARPRRPARAALAVVFAYGILAVAASTWILAQLPAPLLSPETARSVALGGALVSPLLLIGVVRRSLLLLAGRC